MAAAPKGRKTPSLHRVKRKRADGFVYEHVYAWRGGPSIGSQGTEADIRARQAAAIETHRAIPQTVKKRRLPKIHVDEKIALHLAVRRALDNAKQRAVKKDRRFGLDTAFIQRLLTKQEWRCAISGLKFDLSFDVERAHTYNPFGISIDRLDCKEGYTPSNVRLVLTAVNFGLNDWGEEIYLRIAKAVVARGLLKDADPIDTLRNPVQL